MTDRINKDTSCSTDATTSKIAELESKLQEERTGSKALQRISIEMISGDEDQLIFEKILDAAMKIMHSDFSSIQIHTLDEHGQDVLDLLANRGFSDDAAKLWSRVSVSSSTTCSEAMRSGKRVIVTDIENAPSLAGTHDRETYLHNGIYACQSTPLMSHKGNMVGIISTHWAKPHEPTGSQLRLMDVLARQAADFIERRDAKEALRISEANFRAIFERSQFGIIVGDLAGHVLYCNPAIENMLNYSKDELRGKLFSEFTHPDDLHKEMPLISNVIEGKTDHYEIEKRYIRKDGLVIWVKLVGAFMLAGNGEKLGLAMIEDITKRKEAEFTLQKSKERHVCLLRLSDTLRPLTDAKSIQDAAASLLVEQLNASQGSYTEYDNEYGVIKSEKLNQMRNLVGAYKISDFSATTNMLRSGRILVIPNIATFSEIPEDQRERLMSYNIHAALSVPLIKQGTLVAALTVRQKEPRAWTAYDVELVRETAERTWSAVEQAKAEQALRESEKRLEEDLEAISELQKISTSFVQDGDFYSILDRILEAAIHISCAQKGTLQLVSADKKSLEFVSQVGFDQSYTDFFSSASQDAPPVNDLVLAQNDRIIVEDVVNSPLFVGTKALDVQLAAGVRAVQRTALVNRKGLLIGLLSTYWDNPHHPEERVLNYMDLLARQASDIIEKRQSDEVLKKSEEKLRALLMAGSSMIYSMSPDWQIMYQLDGLGFLANTENANKNWLAEYIPIDTQPFVLEKINLAIQQKSIFDLEHPVVRADGETGWVHSTAIPYLNAHGEIIEWFGAANDITERKRAEAALLESEQRALALVEQLQERDRNKNEFLNILSHELRNPLAAVTAGLSLMEMSNSEKHVSTAKGIMQRQLKQLSKLVDDLLDVTRITQNRLQLKMEPIQLNKIVSSIVEDMKPGFREKGVNLWVKITPQPICMMADQVRMTQSIGNILVNALKFTEKDGSVWLTLDQENNDAVISVKDNGIGIGPEIISQLFKPFTQADQSLARHNNNGLGLGLSIVKNLIEMHNGTVSAHSEGIGQGAFFTIRLPIMVNPIVPEYESTLENSKPVRKILIIDDNRDMVEVLSSILEMMGHQVFAAYDGNMGIAKALEIKPDIILCDIGLPGQNGFEVARALKKDEKLNDTLLIAMTGYASEDDIEKSRQSGFEQHLVKPVSVESIEMILSQ